MLEKINSQIKDERFLIAQMKYDAFSTKYMIALEELGIRLTSMTPEEIKSEYKRLLDQNKSYLEKNKPYFKMVNKLFERLYWYNPKNSNEVNLTYDKTYAMLSSILITDNEWEINKGLIEMIEVYAKTIPELAELVPEQDGREFEELSSKKIEEMTTDDLAILEERYYQLLVNGYSFRMDEVSATRKQEKQIKVKVPKVTRYETILANIEKFKQREEELNFKHYQYKTILANIEKFKQRKEDMEIKQRKEEQFLNSTPGLWYGTYELKEIGDQIEHISGLISDSEYDAFSIKYMIALEELGISLISMTPEEIKSEYKRLLDQNKLYFERKDNGWKINDLIEMLYEAYGNAPTIDDGWKINQALLEMIEVYATTIPELAELVPEQDERKYEESSSKKPTDELARLEAGYDRIIDCKGDIMKYAYVARILEKQRIIKKQKETLNELEGQGIDFNS